VAWKIHHRVVEQPAHNQKNPNQSQYQFHGTEFLEVMANFSIQEQSINIIIVFSHFLELLLCLTVETWEILWPPTVIWTLEERSL
jgi:hypothetical protein